METWKVSGYLFSEEDIDHSSTIPVLSIKWAVGLLEEFFKSTHTKEATYMEKYIRSFIWKIKIII